MAIEKNQVVSIHYTLKDSDGNILDSSENMDPLQFIQGLGMIIPGLENALEGKNKGDKLSVDIDPENAYGERSENLIQAVPKDQFDNADTVEIGSQFQVDTEHGPMVLTVIEIKDTEFVLDGNHPLAGMKLHFDVEVVELRAATEDELSHGHIHGPGCNH